MGDKKLILVTSDYPFGSGETFLENEIPVLASYFKEITIVSLSDHLQQTRELPENVKVIRHPVRLNAFQKITSFRHLLHPKVIKEFRRVRNVYSLSWSKAVIATILFSWERARRIAKELGKYVAEDTIAYAYWSDDSAIALAQLKEKNPNITCVSRCHGWDVYFEASMINYLPFREILACRLDLISAISEVGMDYIIKKWKISRTENILCSKLGTSRRLDSSNRISFQIKPLIVSCSNVIPLKRVNKIFESLKILNDQKIRWVHFGDGSELDALKSIVSQESSEHLHIDLVGRVPNHRVIEFYKNHSPTLFINLSTTEGIPVSIMEAMSCGIPVLATDVGGTKELVNDDNGWLVNKDISVDDLSRLIREVLNLPDAAWREKAENAFQTWERNFNASFNYMEFAVMLDRI